MTWLMRAAFTLLVAAFTAGWHVAVQPVPPSSVLAIAALALAGVVITTFARAWRPGTAVTAGPLLRRAIALRRKSWGAAFQRQRDPDAPGRARPRAPSAAPAAA